MTIAIRMTTGNMAFQTRRDVVVALQELTMELSDGKNPTRIMDSNGNTVGTIEYDGKLID